MQTRNILIVDDEADEAELIKRALEGLHVADSVALVRDGEEALAYFFGPGSDSRPLPDLVMLDLRLPKIDGIEVLAKLRASERTKFLPIVVFSASGDQRDFRRCYELCANSYVVKPVEYEQLRDVVGSIARYWLTVNQSPASKPDLPNSL
ncbi:MAG TPA: response regulator [Patescibacteria group bacterium]|nr:response regulator [Patescibacteria group bacterium]